LISADSKKSKTPDLVNEPGYLKPAIDKVVFQYKKQQQKNNYARQREENNGAKYKPEQTAVLIGFRNISSHVALKT